MSRAHYSKAARRDIDEISDYIATDNLDAAIRFCQAIEEAVQNLAEMPGMGPLRHFPAITTPIRSWPIRGFDKYIIFYTPTSLSIEVVRILHGARDLDTIFNNP